MSEKSKSFVNIIASTTNIDSYTNEVVKKIQEKATSEGNVSIIHGVFGDTTECDGVIENIFSKPEGGTFIKVFGNPHLFKGLPKKEILNMMGLPKSMISAVPREFMKGIDIKVFLLLSYLFFRKYFWHRIRTIFHRIHDLNLMKIEYDGRDKESRPVKSLRYAFSETMKRLYEVDVDSSRMILNESMDYVGSRDKYMAMVFIMELVLRLIEWDNAYRLRVQDVFRVFDKDLAQRNVRKEFLKLIDVMIERENQDEMITKWRFIRRIVSLVLRFRGPKKFMKSFLFLVKKEDMIPDDDDWYCSLRRIGYDFNGMTFEERMKIKNEIDKEMGNVSMQIVRIFKNGKEEMGIKI